MFLVCLLGFASLGDFWVMFGMVWPVYGVFLSRCVLIWAVFALTSEVLWGLQYVLLFSRLRQIPENPSVCDTETQGLAWNFGSSSLLGRHKNGGCEMFVPRYLKGESKIPVKMGQTPVIAPDNPPRPFLNGPKLYGGFPTPKRYRFGFDPQTCLTTSRKL